VFGGDPRFDDDEHIYCPPCAARAPWVGQVIEAFAWTEKGSLGDVVARPSEACIDGVLLLRREVSLLHAEEMDDARQDAERKRGGG